MYTTNLKVTYRHHYIHFQFTFLSRCDNAQFMFAENEGELCASFLHLGVLLNKLGKQYLVYGKVPFLG